MTSGPSLTSQSPQQTQQLGATLGALLAPGAVIILTGDLGAGKTQFTKGIARALGIPAEITSPTFNIMFAYPPNTPAPAQPPLTHTTPSLSPSSKSAERNTPAPALYHFDLYRLDHEAELDDIDYFGLLEDGTAVSVVEWGDKFSAALPQDYLAIEFSGNASDEARGLKVWATGPHSTALLTRYLEAAAATQGEGDAPHV